MVALGAALLPFERCVLLKFPLDTFTSDSKSGCVGYYHMIIFFFTTYGSEVKWLKQK